MLLKGKGIVTNQKWDQRPVPRDRRWVMPPTGSFQSEAFVPRLLHRKELKRGICVLVTRMKPSGIKWMPIEAGTRMGWLRSEPLSNKV
jgi:hypothetical protein